ncbi:MAG: 7TM diverse intracellular signaling domain-containing protein [Gammaproteobacteria bacterium]
MTAARTEPERTAGLATLAALLVLLPAMAARAAPDAVTLWTAAEFHVTEESAARPPRGDDAWQPATSARDFALGLTDAVLWLRLRWPAALADVDAPRLVIDNPILDRIDLYREGADGAVHQVSGDGVAYAARAARERLHVFPLPGIAPGDAVLLRIASASPIRFDGRLTGAAALARAEAAHALRIGSFYGLMLGLLLYNLVLAIASPLPSMPWYLGWLVSATAVRGVLDGLPTTLLPWAGWPAVANVAGILIGYATLVTGTLFCRAFLDAPRHAPRFAQVLRLHVLACLGAALLTPVLDPFAAQYLLYGLIAATLVLLGTTVACLLVRGLRQAKFLALTFVALASGIGTWALRGAGVIEAAAIGPYVMHLGMAFEAVLLSFAMADRIRTLQGERTQAEQRLRGAQERFSAALLRAQDRERRRLAAELHDGVGQNALAMKARLERWAARGAEPGALHEGAQLMADVVDEIRGVAHHLHPAMLTRLGLARALARLFEPLAAEGLTVDLRDYAPGDGPLPRGEQALMIYRIVQEAVNNIRKHAGAGRVRLAARCDDGGLSLVVEDDGRGLPPAGMAAGLGLDTMHERARLIGATLDIGPATGRGTRVALHLARSRFEEGSDEGPAG